MKATNLSNHMDVYKIIIEKDVKRNYCEAKFTTKV